MKADDSGRKVLSPSTDRGHPSRIGGGRPRIPGAVHDGPESQSTLDGLRMRAGRYGGQPQICPVRLVLRGPLGLDLRERFGVGDSETVCVFGILIERKKPASVLLE